MKKIHITIIIILAFILTEESKSYAQNFTSISYCNNIVGENLNLTYTIKKKKTNFEFGARYHFNNFYQPYENNTYRNAFYASQFSERLGLVAGISREVISNDQVEIGAFYNLQIGHFIFRDENYYEVDSISSIPSPNGEAYKLKSLNFVGPYTTFENSVGIYCHFKLTERILINQSAGLGINYYFNHNRNQQFPGDPDYPSEFGFNYTVRIGIGYLF